MHEPIRVAHQGSASLLMLSEELSHPSCQLDGEGALYSDRPGGLMVLEEQQSCSLEKAELCADFLLQEGRDFSSELEACQQVCSGPHPDVVKSVLEGVCTGPVGTHSQRVTSR